jgi:hypothetical protein
VSNLSSKLDEDTIIAGIAQTGQRGDIRSP